MKKIGRPRRSPARSTCAAERTNPCELVDATTTSTSASSGSTRSRPTARPPKRRASASPRSGERLTTTISPTPREMRFAAVRQRSSRRRGAGSAVRPGPRRPARRAGPPPTRREAGFSPIAVSVRTRFPTRSACRKSRWSVARSSRSGAASYASRTWPRICASPGTIGRGPRRRGRGHGRRLVAHRVERGRQLRVGEAREVGELP